MSQVVTLADLPISPAELDEKERVFEQEGQWVEWVRYTREIVQGLEERVRFAMWARLAKKFEKFSSNLDQKQASLASDLCVLSAKIWQQEVSRQDLAMSLFTKAYRFDPDNMEALRGTRLISEARGNWKLALQLCTYEQELLKNDREKATLFLHMAEICSKYLNLNDDAVRCVKEATKLIPGFKPAVHYEQMIDDVEGRQRQQFEDYLAEAEKSKTPRQKARCFREAAKVLIGIDPQSDEIETLLQKSIKLEPRNESARLSLQTFYQLNERWEALAAFLIERLGSTQRRQDRLNILKELAKLSEKALNDNDSSIKWHREVLTLDPVDELSINFCTEYYHQHQSWRELVQVYESALKMRRRNQDEGEMLFQIAMILWRKIVDYVEAEKYFKRIKLNDPRQPLMLKFYVDYYTQQEDWRRLLTVLSTQQSEAEEVDDKIVIGFRMAQVAEENLKSNDKAIEMWRAILRLDPSRPEAIEALTRLYELGNKWSALLELLKEQFEYLADDEVTAKIERLEQMVEIYQARMRQPVMVMNTYRQILEIDPRYEPALNALERLYKDSSRWNELSEMVERQAELLLERGDQGALRTRYRDLAQLNEKYLGNLDQAVYYYEEMLSISNELDAIEPLVRLYSGMKDWTSLFETYKRQLELEMEEGERISLLVLAAKVADDQLSFYQESIELWRTVLELNAEHEQAWNSLSDLYQKVQEWGELSNLYAAKIKQLNQSSTPNMDDKLLDDELSEDELSDSNPTGTKVLSLETLDVSEALPWLKKRADLLSEQMDDDEGAAKMWWRVLEAEPHDLQAESFLRSFFTESLDLGSIDRLYRTRSDFDGYLSYLDQLLMGSHDEQVERNILFRRGQVAFNDIKDEAVAIQSWEKALELVTNDEESATALTPLYRSKEQWSKLVSVLNVRYQCLLQRLEQVEDQLLSDDELNAEYLALDEISHELIEVNETKLSAINDAFMVALNTLSFRPTQSSALDLVSRLAPLTMPRLDHQLVERIEELLNTSKLLQNSEHIDAKSALLWQLASTCADPLQEYNKAVSYYWDYREFAPSLEAGDKALKPLASLYEELGEWTELLKVLAMLMERSEEQEETERLLAQMGVIHEQFTQDLDKAECHYLDLLDINANSRSAIRGLQRIASERGDQAQLFEYLDAELAICKSAEDFANLKFRLGEIALEREGAEAALSHFSAALNHFPNHSESSNALILLLDEELAISYAAAVLLEPVARSNGDAKLLVRVLEYILEGSFAELSLDCLSESSPNNFIDNSEVNIEAERDIEIADKDLSSEEAEETRDTSTEESAPEVTEEIAEGSTETSLDHSNQNVSRRDHSALLAELANLIENDLAEPVKAFDVNVKRLEVNPENVAILKDLYRLAEQTDRWETLSEVLSDFSYIGSKELDDNVKSALSRALAEIVEQRLGDQSHARDVWQQVIDAEGDGLEALDQVCRLSEKLEDWEQWIQTLERSLNLVDGSDKLERMQKLAELWYERLDNSDEAVEVYRAILELSPNDHNSEASLERLLKDSQRYSELSEFYQARLDLYISTLNQEESNLTEVVSEEMAKDSSTPESSETSSGDSLESKIAYLRYQLAYVLNTHLREPLLALDYASYNLDIATGVDQRTITLLEQMLLTYCDGSDESLEVRSLGCDLLDQVYDYLGQWEARVSLLEKRIEDADSASQKASYYLAIAHFYETEGVLPQKAYAAIQNGLAQGYGLLNLGDELERLSQVLESWPETGTFLYTQLTEQLDVEEIDRLAMVQRVARIYEQKLDDLHTAIAVYEFGRQESPEELIYLRELNRLYEETKQAESLVQILELRIELEKESLETEKQEVNTSLNIESSSEVDAESSEADEESSEVEDLNYDGVDATTTVISEASKSSELNSYRLQRELSYQLGTILNDELGQAQRAIEVYQRVRADFVPGDHTSYEALSALFKQINDMHGLVELYREQVEYIDDLEQKEQLLSMAAEVSLTQLEQAEDAIELYENILEFNPKSEATLVSMGEIFSVLERYEDRIDILQKRASLYEDQNQSVQYDLERALIHRDQLSDPVSTIEILQEVFISTPDLPGLIEAFESLLDSPEVRLEAAQVLAPVYRDNEQWNEYVSVLSTTLEDRLDVSERASVYRDISSVQKQKLEAFSGAFDSLTSAYELEPDLSELETELEELAALTGRDRELLETYEKAVLEVPDREISLRIKVADLAEQRLGDLEKAITSYQEVLMQDPELIDAINSLERLLEATERYQDLAELYNHKLDVLEDPALRSNTYGLLAEVYENRLSMPMEAIEVWRRQLEDNERHERAFSELERLLTVTESYDELAALYEEWIAGAEQISETIDIKSRLATLTINVLNDGLNYIDHIREIFEFDPLHQASIESLSGLFADENRCQMTGADQNALAELLEPIARGLTIEVMAEVDSMPVEDNQDQTQDLSAVSGVLSTRSVDPNPHLLIQVLDVLQQNEMDPDVRAKQLLELAELQEQVAQDLSAAFDARLIALRFSATELDNRHALQRLALSTQRYQDLADGLEQAANEALEIDDKSSLLLELGKVCESYLDDFDKASFFYQEILSDSPQHQGAVTALETLYARLSQYQPLVDLYLRLADENEDDEQRIRRLFQACEMMRHLDAHDQLIETYRTVLEIDEQNLVAYRELERLFQITEEWGALASLLQERIERYEVADVDEAAVDQNELNDNEESGDEDSSNITSPAFAQQKSESKAELRSRLAKLLEQLNDYDEAIETWRAILEEDDSKFEPAFEALDQMASTWRSLGVDEPRRQIVSEILIPLYFEQGQWEAWIRATEDLLDFIFDPEERTERFIKLAQVIELELNDLTRALDYYAQAFQALPDQSDLEAEVDRLVDSTEAWTKAIEIFETVVAQVFDPEEGTRIWLKVAKLYESKLNDDERAQSAYLKARELSPDSTSAINALREFYSSRELYRSLVDLLKDIAILLEEEDERVEALSYAGKLLTETLNQADEAIEVYSMLRQESPDSVEPLLALETLHRQAENWVGVIECLTEQFELQENDDLKIGHLHAIAKVYGDSLQNVDEQISTLRQVLEIQATEVQSLDLLKALYTERKDWNELSLLLEDERSHYEDESIKAILLDVQLANLNSQKTLQLFTAVELYGTALDRRTVLEENGRSTVVSEIVEGLGQLIHSEEVRAETAELLINYFGESQQFEALKSVYETLVANEVDPIERSTLYINLGQLLRDQLQSPREAFFVYVQALRDDLQNEEILSTLQVIGGEQSMYTEMVQAYAEIAALDPYSELGATLARLRAKLCENRLQDITQATEAWESSLKVDPEHLETLKALSGLYDKQERWSDLISVLETRVEVEPEDFELRVLLGELIVRVHGDSRRAIEQWKVVLMDFPHAESAQRMLENYLSDAEFVNDISLVLEPIYEEQERWASWVNLNHALLAASSTHDDVRREELWTELGQLYAERLGDDVQALNAYSEAFLINPVELELREKLFDLVEQNEAWVAFLPKLIQSTHVVNDPELLVSDYLKIAAWSEQYLNDSDQAVDAYQSVLRVEGDCLTAIQALERIFTQRADWGSLSEVQQRQIDATYDEEQRVELLKKYAHNVWHNLGQVDQAQNIYEELISIDDQELSNYQALEQLLTDLDKQNELLNLLERKLEVVNLDSVEQLKVYKQFIKIAEAIGDQYRAVEIARQAHEEHHSDQELKVSLRRLLVAQENWEDLKELLDQDLETAQGKEQARIALELAELCENKLSLLDDAIDYLMKALEFDSGDQSTFETARRLMNQVMRYDDLLDLTEAYLEANQDLSDGDRISLNIDLAHRAQEEGMQERAVEALERVLAIDSNQPLALSALAKAYEEDGEWSKATDMLQRALDYSENGPAKADALTRLGLIYMDQLDDDTKAKQAFEAALAEAPTAQALDALVMFARDQEDEARVGELLELKLPIAEGRERLSVYRELASYYKRSGREQEQLVILEKAYQEAPEATKLTEMLVERYLKDQRFSEVEPMILKMMDSLKAAGNTKALNRYTYQLGKLKQAQGDQKTAFELFENCKAADPTFAPALVALSQIYVNAARWEEAQSLLSPLLIQRQLSVSDKVEVFYLNGLTRQALGDVRKAKDMFQRALSLNPDHELSRESLNRLA